MRNKSKLLTNIFIGIAFLLGFSIRLIQFISEPSMWKDELFSIINIEKMSMAELLTQQPEYNQIAGVGFYIIQKFIYSLSGNSSTEMVFRLYPFAASLICMWLFYLIAKRFLSETKLVLAVFFIATALGPFAQSFQAKPYSGDIMFIMFFVWLMLKILERQLSRQEYILYGIIGFLGALLSLPTAIFVFVAIGFILIQTSQNTFDKNLIYLLTPWLVGSFWNIYYTKFIVTPETAVAMTEHHSRSFPNSFSAFEFLSFYPTEIVRHISEFITIGVNPFNPIFLTRSLIILLLSLLLLIPILKKTRYDFGLLWLPLLMCLGLVTFYLYPMAGRTAYYAFWPFLLLPLISLKYYQDKLQWLKSWMANTVAIIIVLPSVLIVLAGISSLPFVIEPVKKTLAIYNEKKLEGDVLFVHGSGDLYMEYYAPKMGVEDYILGKNYADVSKEIYANDLEQLKDQGRVWFYFTGYRPESNPELKREDIEQLFLENAELIENYPMGGSYPNYLYLYDFSKK